MPPTRSSCLLMLALSHAVVAAPAQDADPTPRKGIDPAAAAKVKQFEAKRWLGFGARTNAAQDQAVRSEVGGAVPGRRSCTTQIGPSTPSNLGAAGRPTSSPRFGRAQDNVVIVTGSVINVCR